MARLAVTSLLVVGCFVLSVVPVASASPGSTCVDPGPLPVVGLQPCSEGGNDPLLFGILPCDGACSLPKLQCDYHGRPATEACRVV